MYRRLRVQFLNFLYVRRCISRHLRVIIPVHDDHDRDLAPYALLLNIAFDALRKQCLILLKAACVFVDLVLKSAVTVVFAQFIGDALTSVRRLPSEIFRIAIRCSPAKQGILDGKPVKNLGHLRNMAEDIAYISVLPCLGAPLLCFSVSDHKISDKALARK